MSGSEERPLWMAYEVRQADAWGYEKIWYDVREEYKDGSTRHIHSELFDRREAAEHLAAQFNANARKGMAYDNTVKRWN